MSHASVLVVIEPKELEAAKGDVNAAVTWQMEPFDENGEWFRDGSRWDWWVIGGRFTGSMARKDVVQRGEIDLVGMRERRVEKLRKNYVKAKMEAQRSEGVKKSLEFLYGVRPEESMEEYLEREIGDEGSEIAHYAFLKNRHWHEHERMGWFGGAARTECEIAAEVNKVDDVEAMIRRCKTKDKRTGACIVTWNEPWEVWRKEFWRRFVDGLKSDVALVTVDYHV